MEDTASFSEETVVVRPDESLQLTDNFGQDYRLDFYGGPTSWILKVYDNRIRAAYLNCIIQGDTLFIGDIHVLEAARLPENILCSWLRGMFGLKAKTANYQRRGLGSKLLKFVIERARINKLALISGNLSARDIATNPNLPKWYENNGFQVQTDAKTMNQTILLKLS